MGPSLTMEGATTHVAFGAYLERVLAPTLRAGQAVMVNSLSAHKGSRVAEVEEYGYALMYRPMRSSQRKVLHPSW
jgi:hypothetical protein